jgi:putative ABC transport system permease protein
MAASTAISLAAAVLLAALVGQQFIRTQAPRAAEMLIAPLELHLAATDRNYPYIAEDLLEAMRDDPRVTSLATAVSVRAVDMPGLASGALDRETFYSHKPGGMGGWITGRRDSFLAWDDENPRGTLVEGRWPSLASEGPIEIVVPQVVRDQPLESWRHLESDTGVYPAQVVGVTRANNGQVATQQGIQLVSRQVSRAAAEKLAGHPLRPSHARFELNREAAKGAFIDDWRGRLTSLPGRLELWDSESLNKAGLNSPAVESARLAVQTAVLLASACVMCIALSAQGNAVRERIRHIGLLRSLGADRSTPVVVLLCEAIVMAIVGSAGAVAIVWVAMSSAARFVPAFVPPAAPDSGSVFIMGTIILVGSVAGCIWPAIVVARVLPGETAAQVDSARATRIARRAAVAGGLILMVTTVIVFITPAGSMLRAQTLSWCGTVGLSLAAVCITPAAMGLVCRACTRPVAWLTRTNSLILRDQITADGARSAGSVIAVAVGLGGFIWMLCWGASMLNAFVIDSEIPRWLVSIHPYGLDQEETERLLATPTFSGFFPLTLVDTRLAVGNDSAEVVPTLVMGLDVDRAVNDGPSALPFRFVAGQRGQAAKELVNGDACLISAWYAASHRTKLGDRISVAVPRSEGLTERVYKVVGIVELTGWRMATKQNKVRLNGDKHEVMVVLDANSVRRDFHVGCYANFLLGNPLLDGNGNIPGYRQDLPEVEADAASEVERESLEAKLAATIDLTIPVDYELEPNVKVQANSRVVQVDDLDRTRAALWGEWGGKAVKRLGQLPLIILTLSLFSVSGTLMISMRSRAHELGVLRSCGLTRVAMVRLCIAEGVLLGLSAIPVAALLGGGSAWIALEIASIIGYRLDFSGIDPTFVVPWSWLWPGAVITAAVCCLAAVWAGWRISRVAPAALITG